MADNVSITPGAGALVAADQLPTGEYVQYAKLMDGTLDGTAKAVVMTSAPGGGEGGLVVRPIPSGTQPISAAALPLPAGAAQEHVSAALPHAARLTDGASFYDARSIRALTSADVVSAVQSGAWSGDITDRSARLLGHVTVDSLPNVTIGSDLVGLAKDASLSSIFGSPSDMPGAYTVLDRLQRLQTSAVQQTTALQSLLSKMTPAPARKSQPTLLHRS